MRSREKWLRGVHLEVTRVHFLCWAEWRAGRLEVEVKFRCRQTRAWLWGTLKCASAYLPVCFCCPSETESPQEQRSLPLGISSTSIPSPSPPHPAQDLQHSRCSKKCLFNKMLIEWMNKWEKEVTVMGGNEPNRSWSQMCSTVSWLRRETNVCIQADRERERELAPADRAELRSPSKEETA